MAARPRWLPRPFEILTLGAALIALGALRARGIPLGWSSLQYMAAALLGRLPGLIVLGLGLHLLVALVRRRSPLPWLRQLGEPASLALWLRLWLALLATTWTDSWLKVSIPLLRTAVHDGALWALDRALHLGISPSVFAAELVAGSPLAGPLDLWYALWLTSVLGLQSSSSCSGTRCGGGTSPWPAPRSGWPGSPSTFCSRQSVPASSGARPSRRSSARCRARRRSRSVSGGTTSRWSQPAAGKPCSCVRSSRWPRSRRCTSARTSCSRSGRSAGCARSTSRSWWRPA